MDEIALRLQTIIREHGPRAVALYSGSMLAWEFLVNSFVANAFMAQIGSPRVFGPGSIDQPGKPLAIALHGNWEGGAQEFDESDSWLLVGTNAAISKNGGIPWANPEKRLRDEKRRGLKLIVIDPRRSETAEKADLHIQPIPGEDPTILAGIIRVILAEEIHNKRFVSEETQGLEALKAAVGPFTPEYVARRAGIPPEQVNAAARLFAAGRAGRAGCGTGPNMAPRGTLTEYLALVLNTLVGSWHKEGDRVTNPGVLRPRTVERAQARPRPERAWGYGEKLRVRGLGENASGMPTSALAEEILRDGEGQVRALLSFGGNPMRAWPDQLLTHAAMQKLDLSVSGDIKMSLTAELSDYVIAPKLSLETPSNTLNAELLPAYGLPSFPEPYAQYAPAIVAPPPGSDVIEEWEFFYGLARRMGLQLDIFGLPIDMANRPTTDDLLEMASTGSRIPLSVVKARPGGRIFDDETFVVLPREEGWQHRLEIGNVEMMAELGEVAGEPLSGDAGFEPGRAFSHRLVSRRMRDTYNSCGHEFPGLVAKYRYNPAFMNPDDMRKLDLATGDVVEISTDRATIRGIVEAEDAIRPGVISMSHGWGGAPGQDEDSAGSATSRLIDAARWFEPRSGIPVMSALPVNVTKATRRLPISP
jgi:anaerobic selenocysteine-containing dehydrogenase